MPKQSVYLQRPYAEEYDKDRFGSSFGGYLHDQEVDTFVSMINGNHGRLLDVGAGTGKLSLALMRRSRQIVSVDFSAEMLRLARSKAEKEGITLKCAISDAHQLCFRDTAFECVVCSRVLMHLADWRQGFSEMCRVAGRMVVIDFPPLVSFAGLYSLCGSVKSLFSGTTQGHKAFLIRTIQKEFEKYNFRIVEVEKGCFLPIAFHRCINSPSLSVKCEFLFRVFGLVRFLGAPVTVKAMRTQP